MSKRKILFVADFSITKEDILNNKFLFDSYDVEVDVVEVCLGSNEEERAAYILKTEQEGPEWTKAPQELIEKAVDAEIIITDFAAIGKEVIEAAPNLKLIGVLRSGIENVNREEARKQDVQVICSPGRVAAPVADYTVAMMIAETRNIVRSNLVSNGGDWKIRFNNFAYSHNMANKTVGIIGYGIIGQMVAERLKPFGVKVIAYEEYMSSDKVRELGAEPVSFDELLRQSDYVTVHARLSEQTKHMIGKEVFEKMKNTAIFVNTARAGLVDEEALIQALQNNEIGGAALDVFAQEPISKDNPLLEMENVTLTPHLAGTTSNVGSNSIAVILKDLDLYFSGEPMRNTR
ncbi:MAG: 2-hydroxyacid dehydrogenase [Suipraeoptans sp.]